MSRNPCAVKLCGTSSVEDARLAELHGADYIGVLCGVAFSERDRTLEEARDIAASVFTPIIILTFNQPTDTTVEVLDATQAFGVQLLGHETPEQTREVKSGFGGEVWKSLFMPPKDGDAPLDEDALLADMKRYADAGADKLLLDTAAFVGGKHRFGGTGVTSDWEVAARLIAKAPVPTFLSGGISAANVAEAGRSVKPFGVDLASGVEATRGVRDPDKTAALFDALRKG
ncbi:MAG: phosphoribosylanthranilate isomerase [Candidatus Poribacteria bacterium]|nr:phosphoribosylanthranilate isomerase [Candidatus Poribacteria bacterium]